MKLRTKVIGFVILISILTFATLVMFFSLILHQKFSQLDQQNMRSKMESILSTMQGELNTLSSVMTNYSNWNETYQYIQDPGHGDPLDHPYIQSNYGQSTYTGNKLQFIALYNKAFNLLYSQWYNPDTDTMEAPPQELLDFFKANSGQLLTFQNADDTRTGYINTIHGLALLVINPITDEAKTTSDFGAIVALRLLNEDELNRIRIQANTNLILEPIDLSGQADTGKEPIMIKPTNSHEAKVYGIVPDIFGKPLFQAVTLQKREVLESGQSAVRYLVIVLMIVMLLLMGTTLFFFNRFIMARIRRIVFSMGTIGSRQDFSWRIPIEGNDEFSMMERKFNDMMDSLDQAQNEIYRQSMTDPLTQLPNRKQFFEKLRSFMQDEDTDHMKLALIFLDLDDFKSVNDTWGHDCGDKLLQEVASRMKSHLHAGEWAYRLGGDEFVILLTRFKDRDHAMERAESVHQSLQEPFLIQNRWLTTTASLGISFYPEDAQDLSVFLHNADLAMYQAKLNGKNTLHGYSRSFELAMQRQRYLEQQLAHAQADNQLMVYYQPIVSLETMEIVKVEALLRWKDGAEGFISPAEFIPIAESTGLILPIGEWVIQQVCEDLTQMRKDYPHLRAAINISAIQLEQEDFPGRLMTIIASYGLEHAALELEITESMMLSNQKALDSLHLLKDAGFGLSLDDFGTGYSSLSYLRRFPVDNIKLDRSFLLDILDNLSDRMIVKTIIDLSHSLSLKIVAEGVEQEEQLQLLRTLGCDKVQGYHIGKPLPYQK